MLAGAPPYPATRKECANCGFLSEILVRVAVNELLFATGERGSSAAKSARSRPGRVEDRWMIRAA